MNEAVEREFNPRVSVPDTEPYIKRGAEQSAKAYATHEHQSDLSYAPGDLTTLDYFPCGQPGRPVFGAAGIRKTLPMWRIRCYRLAAMLR